MKVEDFYNKPFRTIVELLKPISKDYFNPCDECSPSKKNWEECVGYTYGDRLVGAESNINKIYHFQVRELGMDTLNYGISAPERYGHKGSVIVEVCFPPHQMWKFYNMSKPEEIEQMISDVLE